MNIPFNISFPFKAINIPQDAPIRTFVMGFPVMRFNFSRAMNNTGLKKA
jgi:hypothetical protein